MIHENLVDKDGIELSVHYNQKKMPVIVIEDPNDGMAIGVFQLTIEDAQWIIDRLKTIIKNG